MASGRLIVAMCVYNEEDFIIRTIDSLLAKVRDVDVIEIMDGAWENGGKTTYSTDKTKMLIDELAHKHHNRCDIVYRAKDEIFENEADKRNYQLEVIQETYGYEDYTVLVLDADERFAFPNGMFEVWMKDYLGLPFIGCIKTFAHSSSKPMYVPRLFPGGLGIHYHDKRSMIVHTGDHMIEVDYNLAAQEKTFGPWYKNQPMEMKIYEMKDFFIVNFYPTRSRERLLEKGKYAEFQESVESKNTEPCNYKQKIRGTIEEDVL